MAVPDHLRGRRCAGHRRSSPPQHGWPVLAAVIGGGVVAAAIGVVIGLLTIRLGNLYVALVTLTFGLLMERLVFNLKDFSQFGAGVAVARPEFAISDRAFTYMALGVLRDHRHPHREPAAFHDRPRAQRGALERERVPHHGAERHPDEDARVGPGRVRGRRRRRSLRASRTSRRSRSTTSPWSGLVWLAVLVTFGVRSNIAALLAGLRLRVVAGVRPDVPAAELDVGAAPGPAVRSRCRSSWRRTPRARCTSGRWGSRAGSTSSAARGRCPRRPRSPAATIPGSPATVSEPPPPDEPAEPTAEITRS